MDTSAAQGDRAGMLRRPRVRLGAVLALAVAAGIVAWATVGRGSSTSPTQTTAGPVAAKPIAPVALSSAGLRTLARAVGQPIYWDGPKPGYMYELRRTSNGNVYVRYLPPGVKAGAPGAKYLIVATYPFRNALNALKAVANGGQIKLPGGGIAAVDASYPQSVHLAFPGVGYQVEVYDPSPTRARRIALSGHVRPVH
jgi:hypothetical protein